VLALLPSWRQRQLEPLPCLVSPQQAGGPDEQHPAPGVRPERVRKRPSASQQAATPHALEPPWRQELEVARQPRASRQVPSTPEATRDAQKRPAAVQASRHVPWARRTTAPERAFQQPARQGQRQVLFAPARKSLHVDWRLEMLLPHAVLARPPWKAADWAEPSVAGVQEHVGPAPQPRRPRARAASCPAPHRPRRPDKSHARHSATLPLRRVS
jgi:hypothetical protein